MELVAVAIFKEISWARITDSIKSLPVVFARSKNYVFVRCLTLSWRHLASKRICFLEAVSVIFMAQCHARDFSVIADVTMVQEILKAANELETDTCESLHKAIKCWAITTLI